MTRVRIPEICSCTTLQERNERKVTELFIITRAAQNKELWEERPTNDSVGVVRRERTARY
jgi:hypothetical protein